MQAAIVDGAAVSLNEVAVTESMHCAAGPLPTLLSYAAHAQRYDTDIMLLILPHALFFAITASDSPEAVPNTDKLASTGAEARAAVLTEVGAVVAACLAESGSNGTPHTALHLQAIMAAFDALERWHDTTARGLAQRRAELAAAVAKSKGKPGVKPPTPSAADTELRRKVAAVAAFQAALLPRDGDDSAAVTLEQLALASQRCGAHARALRQYEAWLRHRKGQFNNASRGWCGTRFEDTEVRLPPFLFTATREP